METAKHTVGREREVVLNEVVRYAVLFVAGTVPALHEEPSLVAEHFWFDDQRARERLLQVREQRLDGIAAELARSLEAGRPCPVCGSGEHPAPSQAVDAQVDTVIAAVRDIARAAA